MLKQSRSKTVIKSSVLLLFFTLFLSIFTIPVDATNTVFQYQYNSVSLGTDLQDNLQLLHSSGKFVNAYYDYSASKLKIIVINVLGSLITTTNITVTSGGLTLLEYPSTVGYGKTRIKLVEHNSTDVLIFLEAHATPTDYYVKLWVVHYKINSGLYYIYAGNVLSYGTYATNVSPLASVYYSSKYYIFSTIHRSSGLSGIIYLTCTEYNPVTKTVTSKSTTNIAAASDYTDYTSVIGLVQNSQTYSELYLFFSTADEIDKPHFYKYLLTTFTATALCDFPLYTKWDSDRHNIFIGGGNITSGDQHYLYFAFVKSTLTAGGDRLLNIVYDVIQFNQSISSANLIIQYPRYANMQQYFDTLYSTRMFVQGYMINYTQFVLYHPQMIMGCFEGNVNIQLPDSTIKTTLSTSVSDFFDMTDDEWTFVSLFANYNSFPYYIHFDLIGRTYTNNAFIEIDYETNTIYVFTGVTPVLKTYTITLAKSPNDTTMSLNKLYAFSATVKQNGIAFYCPTTLLLDNNIIDNKYTNINGIASYTPFTFSTSGVRKITIQIYDNLEMVKSQDFNYYLPIPVQPSQPLTSAVITPPDANIAILILGSITALIVPVSLFIALALAFSQIAGVTGFLMGSMLAVFVNIQLGFIPLYYVYLFAFVLAIGFVFIIMGKRNSSSEGG